MSSGRPWHLPVVGWIALLWSAVAVAHYLLTRFEVGAYLALLTPEQASYFTTLPLWIDVLWPLAVWSGLMGALCLLGGARLSAFLLGLAALAMVLATLGLILTDPPVQTVTGPAGLWIVAGATTVYLLLWVYARQMHAEGSLP